MRVSPSTAIPASQIRLIADLADRHPGTLRLFYGEDTLPTPEFLKDAARRALEENRTFYTPNAGYPTLREAIAAQILALHGATIDPMSEVVVTASGMMALTLACQATLGPGTSALVVTPLWPNIAAAVRITGAEAVEVPLSREGGRFDLDFDRLERTIRPDTRMIALASPGNPTGWTATEADWSRLAALCDRHDLWLLADGVYERLVEGRPVAPSPLTLPEARGRTIVAQSFSKTYRMTGWRVGYAVAPAELGPSLAVLQEFSVSHAFGVAQETARVALTEGEPFVAESQARYARHRRIAVERLSGVPGVSVPEADGAFYVFPKFEGLTDSFAFCSWLVETRRVGLAPGSAFGLGGEGHIRLCFAVDESTLEQGLARLIEGWSAWNAR